MEGRVDFDVLQKMIWPDFDPSSEPRAVGDLTYAQLVSMVEAIRDPDTDEDIGEFYMETIERTLPGANVSDLIFWPNEWFRDEEMLHADMEASEIAAYLIAWTGKKLPGSEDVRLPTIPVSKRSGPPRAIEL